MLPPLLQRKLVGNTLLKENIYVTIFFRNRRQVHTFGLDIPFYLTGFKGFGYEIFSVWRVLSLGILRLWKSTSLQDGQHGFAFIKQQLFTTLKAQFFTVRWLGFFAVRSYVISLSFIVLLFYRENSCYLSVFIK